MSTESTSSRTVQDGLGVLVLLVTLYFFVLTASLRLDYPYDLEWMEGGMLIHALRIQHGQGLYVTPSADFIPYIYPPLYPWVLAWLGDIFGLDYWVGRSVSILGTVMAMSAIVVGLRKESVSWGVSCLGGALFLSTFEDAGTFFDLTRADALMMGFMAWSIVLARQRVLWASGVLCWLAFLSKHNAAIIGVPIALWLWRDHGVRDAWRFGAWSAIPALVSIGWLQYSTEGLFLTYLLDVPAHHPIVGYRFAWLSELEMATAVVVPLLVWMGWYATSLWSMSKVRAVLWGVVLMGCVVLSQLDLSVFPMIAGSSKNGVIPFAVSIWGLAVGIHCVPSSIKRWFQRNESAQSIDFWMAMCVILLFFSALMRGHHGGFTNVLMPGLWVLCIVLPLGLSRIGIPTWVLTMLLVSQVWLGRWQMEDLIPTEADREAGDKLVEMLSNESGPIWSPHAPWLPVQAGHPPTTHLIALWDIDHEDGPLVSYVSDIQRDVSKHRWPVIITADKRLGFGVQTHYQVRQTIRPSGNVFKPKVGWKVRPSYLYRPKPPSKGDAVPDTSQ